MEGEIALLAILDVEAEKEEELGDPNASFEQKSCTAREERAAAEGVPCSMREAGCVELGMLAG